MSVLQQILFGLKADTPATVSYVANYTSSSGNPVTFTASSIGTSDSTRKVIIGVSCLTNSGSGYSSTSNVSVTVGGNSATSILEYSVGNRRNALFIIDYPSGTTADIVVTNNTNMSCSIVIYAAYNLQSSTPVATNNVNVSSGATSCDVNTQSGGIVVGHVNEQGNSGITYTWSGLTEDIDSVAAASNCSASGASYAASSGETPRSISVTPSSSITNTGVCLVASFR